MAVTIASGNNLTVRGGRRICVTSTGQLWHISRKSATGDLHLYYSNDDGSTWTEDTGAVISDSATGSASEFAMFIDGNDRVFVAYEIDTGAFLQIKTGTISGNAITWYGTNQSTGYSSNTEVDVVAFDYSGSTRVWVAWVGNSSYDIRVHGFTWAGSAWTGQFEELHVRAGGVNQCSGLSLDFRHTGDGVTADSGNPDLAVSWLVPNDDDLFCRILPHAYDLVWGTGTPRTLFTFASGGQVGGESQCRWDGTRWIIAALHTSPKWLLFERDAADTATTDRECDSTGISAGGGMCMTYDSATGDVILIGRNSSNYPLYSKFDRSGASWDTAATVIEAEAAIAERSVGSRSSINYAYALWELSGGDIRGELVLSYNSDPTAPTVTSPTDGDVKDVAEVLPVVWTFNDPDEGDTQSAYSLRKQIGTGSYSYWNGSVFTASESAATKIASSGTTHTISSSWGADGDANHKYAIKTWDAADAGPSDWDEVYVTPSAQDNPTVTAITTVTAPTYSVTWTVATQTKYRVRVYDDSGGSPVTSTVFYDSGTQVSAVTSHSTPFPDNSVTRHVGVVTWNDEGLLSDEDTEQLAVSYLVPPTPTVSMSTTGSESGVIWVSINNPTPGGGETVTDSNEVYRRVASEGGDGIRVAQGVAEDGAFNDYGPLSEVVYQYRARAVNAGLGTAAYGAWTT